MKKEEKKQDASLVSRDAGASMRGYAGVDTYVSC